MFSEPGFIIYTFWLHDGDKFHHDISNLVLNLAHFGGGNEWLKFIYNESCSELTWLEKTIALIRKYPNIYSDISYTLYEPTLYPQLKALLADGRLRYRILFGSDFYMVEQQTTEREFFLKLRAYLGEDDYPLIANINPRTFLNLKTKK